MNVKKAIIPIAIILVSALATRALVRSRPQVETHEVEPLAPLVRVIEVGRQDLAFDVRAQGTVLPRTETTLIAQVAGKVIRTSSSFETGGFFSRGEALVELDPRDYQVAVRRARAQVAQARLQVVQQEAEAQVAVEEWQQLGEGEPTALVMRQPQVAQAQAALEAAEAELEKAELDLERTHIRAPFDGRVRSKQVDLGQFLTPGAPLATIHATDYAEIRLPVPDDQVSFLDLPFAYRTATAAKGPEVTLRARFGRDVHSWQGRIVRTEGELDSRTRMLNLVARVEDPYGAGNPDRPPLVVGMFVEAEIEGRPATDVVVLPRSALRPDADRDQVLVVDGDSRLRFRDVEVVRLEGERAIIGDGLEPGEAVCVSPLDIVTDGMQVRSADRSDDRAAAADAPEMSTPADVTP
jgi:RND family efflux transporter MFP subunit